MAVNLATGIKDWGTMSQEESETGGDGPYYEKKGREENGEAGLQGETWARGSAQLAQSCAQSCRRKLTPSDWQ